MNKIEAIIKITTLKGIVLPEINISSFTGPLVVKSFILLKSVYRHYV